MNLREIGWFGVANMMVHIVGVAVIAVIMVKNQKWLDKHSLRGWVITLELFYAASILTSFMVLFASVRNLGGPLDLCTFVLVLTFFFDCAVVGRGLGSVSMMDPVYWQREDSFMLFMAIGGVGLFDIGFVITSVLSKEALKRHRRENPQVNHASYSIANLLFGNDDEGERDDVEKGRHKKKLSYNNKRDKRRDEADDHYDPMEDDYEIATEPLILPQTVVEGKIVREVRHPSQSADATSPPMVQGRFVRAKPPQSEYVSESSSAPPTMVQGRRVIQPIQTAHRDEFSEHEEYLTPVSGIPSPKNRATSPLIGRVIR